MVQTWFISDTHFQHENIIKFCNRPFKSIEQMNEALIRNWNSRVKKDDNVFFLGDFIFTYKGSKKAIDFSSRLNGNITFIRGNHDNNNTLKTDIHSLVLNKNGRNFYLVHNPDDREPGMINIVGHVHTDWKFKNFDDGSTYGIDCINVGVDQWGFKPITFNEMMKGYKKWKNEA